MKQVYVEPQGFPVEVVHEINALLGIYPDVAEEPPYACPVLLFYVGLVVLVVWLAPGELYSVLSGVSLKLIVYEGLIVV